MNAWIRCYIYFIFYLFKYSLGFSWENSQGVYSKALTGLFHNQRFLQDEIITNKNITEREVVPYGLKLENAANYEMKFFFDDF